MVRVVCCFHNFIVKLGVRVRLHGQSKVIVQHLLVSENLRDEMDQQWFNGKYPFLIKHHAMVIAQFRVNLRACLDTVTKIKSLLVCRTCSTFIVVSEMSRLMLLAHTSVGL